MKRVLNKQKFFTSPRHKGTYSEFVDRMIYIYNKYGKNTKGINTPDHIRVIHLTSNKHLKLKNSKPCFDCVRLMLALDVKTITYSTGNPSDPFITQKIKDINPKLSSGARLWLKTPNL